MGNRVEFFASIRDGDVILIGQATPEHELTDSQIELTKDEYYFLKSVRNLKHAYAIYMELSAKINNLEMK